jgi:hypothetical protein
MNVLEFLLVAHSILTGLGIAEILRGFADLIRGAPQNISRRMLGIASWALILYFQIWWATWRLGHRDSFSFFDFLLILLPVLILYLLARLSFPKKIDGTDLRAYYQQVSPALWIFVAAIYLTFAFYSPFLHGEIIPVLLASQLGIAGAALVAIKVRQFWYQSSLIVVMLAQVFWRGFVITIGS